MFMLMFPSAISRYLVSDTGVSGVQTALALAFPSAISRYLVSDRLAAQPVPGRALVSIRYIAVLGI